MMLPVEKTGSQQAAKPCDLPPRLDRTHGRLECPREPIAIVVRPGDEEPWAVFSRQLDDRVARLDLTRDHLVDRRSGERWDPERGLKAEDPSNPEILVQLLATSFPSDYMNFYPSGEVWEPNV
jgi:hypothetical protein